MRLKYKCHIMIKFENSIQSSFQKSFEGAEFLESLYNYLILLNGKYMKRQQDIGKILQIEIRGILARFIIILIYFGNYLLCYHNSTIEYVREDAREPNAF